MELDQNAHDHGSFISVNRSYVVRIQQLKDVDGKLGRLHGITPIMGSVDAEPHDSGARNDRQLTFMSRNKDTELGYILNVNGFPRIRPE